MTNLLKWLDLQLFAGEGGASGTSSGGEGGEGAASVGTTDVDGQARLRELGVPQHILDKRAKRNKGKASVTATMPTATPEVSQQTPSAKEQNTETNTEEMTAENKPNRMSWDEIKNDPEYNKEIQAIVQARLKNAKAAEDALSKLTPALELLARQHNLDINNMDYDALSKAISDDSSFYEELALQKGVSIETAKKDDQAERATLRQQREEARTIERQKVENHFNSLRQQEKALKAKFPNFSLEEELKNSDFFRMTRPEVNVPVETAYYAVHKDEIQMASMQIAAQKTAEKISNSIQAGTMRPDENGIRGQAASVTTFDYSRASKEQRNAIKNRIREAAARGEKIYPGMI